MSGFLDHPNFQSACQELAEHPLCSSNIKQDVIEIATFSTQQGYVTHEQASYVGREHKRVVEGGVYKKHNWWGVFKQ